MDVFETAGDFSAYTSILKDKCRQAGVQIWTYCLMSNHVHFVAVPEAGQSLSIAFGKTHERYARLINVRNGWTGHLWQQRFYSVPMDLRHTIAAIRYVLLNPVRAGLVKRPEDWPYSSARAHLGLVQDPLIRPGTHAGIIDDWESFLAGTEDRALRETLERNTRSGLPAGDHDFIRDVEDRLGRRLHPRPVGRPRKTKRPRIQG